MGSVCHSGAAMLSERGLTRFLGQCSLDGHNRNKAISFANSIHTNGKIQTRSNCRIALVHAVTMQCSSKLHRICSDRACQSKARVLYNHTIIQRNASVRVMSVKRPSNVSSQKTCSQSTENAANARRAIPFQANNTSCRDNECIHGWWSTGGCSFFRPEMSFSRPRDWSILFSAAACLFFDLQLFLSPAMRPRKRAQSFFQPPCIILSSLFLGPETSCSEPRIFFRTPRDEKQIKSGIRQIRKQKSSKGRTKLHATDNKN